MMCNLQIKRYLIILNFVVLSSFQVLAAPDSAMEEMQRQLNSQVMNKPFSAADSAKLEVELDAMLKKGVKPVTTPSRYWRPGYTCGNLLGFSLFDYRNCRYHYRYYGRYW